MNTPEVIQFLKAKVPLFAAFSDERLAALVGGSRVASFEAKEVIVHHGAEATHFSVVLSGTVAASVAGDGGARQALGQLKAGDTFGEMALMTEDTVLADFIAESRCEVLLIPVTLFQSVIVAEPGAVQHLFADHRGTDEERPGGPGEGGGGAAPERGSLRAQPHG